VSVFLLQKQPSPKATVAALFYTTRATLSYTTRWDTISYAKRNSNIPFCVSDRYKFIDGKLVVVRGSAVLRFARVTEHDILLLQQNLDSYLIVMRKFHGPSRFRFKLNKNLLPCGWRVEGAMRIAFKRAALVLALSLLGSISATAAEDRTKLAWIPIEPGAIEAGIFENTFHSNRKYTTFLNRRGPSSIQYILDSIPTSLFIFISKGHTSVYSKLDGT
jgi:hypothetical protein